MRRIVVVATAVVALLGALSPPVSAQAPAPKVTITGLIDNATTGGKNAFDGNYAKTDDSTWHARSRGVFTITGEVGKAKGVLALEMDMGWGQMGTADGVGGGQIGANTASQGGFGSGAGLPFTNVSADLGVDIAGGALELKNLYVEFPVPWIPMATVTRLGAQPTQVTMKNTVFTTDYAGAWLSSTIAPFLKFNLTFAQVEEQFVGQRASNGFIRGDDFVIAPSFDVEPMKGVKIRPFWIYFSVQGNTNAASRCRVQCAGLPSNGSTATVNQLTGLPESITGTSSITSLGNYRTTSTESRHYLGIDAQTNLGPFYFDPTVIYETSNVDVYRLAASTAASASTYAVAGTGTVGGACTSQGSTLTRCLFQGSGDRVRQSTSSWLVDLRGGWRGGPLLVEGLFVWTPGDDAQHDSFRSTKVYHPVSTDGAGWGGWADILSPGTVDYLTGAAPGINENAGLGRYGIMRFGGRASYALTPAFSVRAGWNSWWTDTKVDTDASSGPSATQLAGLSNSSYGSTPCAGPGGQAANCTWTSDRRGDSDYVGTEASVGLSYSFAPGLAFDAVFAHLFAGPALNNTNPDPKTGTTTFHKAQDADLAAARVRYQF